MKTVEINAFKRTETGKNKVNKLRNNSQIPATIYGTEPKSLTISANDAHKLYQLRHDNFLVKLNIDEKEQKDALLKNIQLNPVKNNVIHLDFLELVKGKSIVMKVPIELLGSPIGLKLGGITEHFLWEITIECLPKDIPEHITADISQLNIGDSIHISDLQIPSEVKILDKPEQVIVTIGLPTGMVEEKEEEVVEGEEEATAEGEEKEGKTEKKSEEKTEKAAETEKK